MERSQRRDFQIHGMGKSRSLSWMDEDKMSGDFPREPMLFETLRAESGWIRVDQNSCSIGCEQLSDSAEDLSRIVKMLEHMVEQDEPIFAALQRKLGEVASMDGALRICGCYVSRVLVQLDALSGPSCQPQGTQQLAGTAPDVERSSARARRYQFVEEAKERLAPQKTSAKQNPPRHSGHDRSCPVVVPKNAVTDLISHPGHPASTAFVYRTRVSVVVVRIDGTSIGCDHLGILKDRCAFGAPAIAKPARRSVLAIRTRE